MAEGLSQFRDDMDKIVQIAGSGQVSSKAQRYLRAYEAGLPQDITVRWFPKEDLEAMEARVADLTGRSLEVWISQGLPWNPDIDNQVTSVEKKTDLIKGLKSVSDFQERGMPRLAQWEADSWAKMFYDTPQRSLISGTIRFDTNRNDSVQGDMRAIRLEAASGISDVRDLDRQMSARQVVVVHPDPKVISLIEDSLGSLNYPIIGISDIDKALESIFQIVQESKSKNDPKAKPSEPKAIMLDFIASPSASSEILVRLKDDKDASSIPIIPIVEDEFGFPTRLRPMVASFVQLPMSKENVRLSVFLTGFRLVGDSHGFQLPNLGLSIQQRIDNLLNIVFGPDRAYRRMMMQIANAEQRPTIAFEFKLVPTDPYDFFFLDYEWSGLKSSLHRFDWAYAFGDGD